MHKICLLIAILTLFLPEVQAQDSQGWISLFDGQTLRGWQLFKKPGTASAWEVRDGAIYLDITKKEGRGDLVTDKAFGDFHLKFEWKAAKGSNSGVIFFVQDRDPYKATWHTGPEFQVIDNTGYADPLGPKQTAGSLYDLIACPPSFIKPTGEWNASEIIFEKGVLSFVLNGNRVFSVTHDSDEWTKLIKDSKFRTMRDFAKATSGKIAFQDHGGEVWYRNILIKSL